MGITINGVKVAGVGIPGRGAYQAALEGGYTGTEEEFNKLFLDVVNHLSNVENPHNVTAEQIGADPSGSAAQALTDAKNYADQQINAIPTPDVSGQIDAHNTSTETHLDIRTAITDAEANAKKYTDDQIANIPTPDVSGQIDIHNSDGTAHTDIRTAVNTAQSTADAAKTAAATAQNTANNKLPLAGGTITGTTPSTSTSTGALIVNGGVGIAGSVYAASVHGAVYNDYAEYRNTVDVKAGQCVFEVGNGDLKITQGRLISGCSIVSDTFGFAIGETENAKTPLAVAGRVLVYTDVDRHEFKAGDSVCSGFNGTISKMTREEIMRYPDCIIGIVSEIPEYEIWGTNDVIVDGRIWIKLR